MCFAPQRRAIFRHRTFKLVRTRQFFNILTCKCAFRYSRVPFLNIATAKMAPRMWCFVRFDLQMCFAPQRRAIFRHRNFKKCSDTVSLFTIFTCKCASRHSRVPFLNIATSKMAPTMWWFAHFDLQMCFAPQRRAIFHLSARTATSAPAALARLLFEHQEPRIIEKTQGFATSLTFFTRVPSF